MKLPIVVGTALALLATGVMAEDDKTRAVSIEQVTILGSRDAVKTLPGSAFLFDRDELEKLNYSDINRILKQAPGIYIQEEEGYGLRPNIGIRGAGPDRSGKITLMEDGVLIAPAPYSAPAAYYFPTTARMESIEVLKGPSLLQYGPNTVGGAVNLVSTPIPSAGGGRVLVEVGGDNEQRMHAYYGDRGEQWGYLVETHQHEGDGFKSIDRSSRDTGFDKSDYVLKFRLNTAPDQGPYQQLDLKLEYNTETSNQSYLGLTDVDFKADPDRRYGLSELDQMETEHTSIILSHYIELAADQSLKTTLYRNDFKRNWYKLAGGGGLIAAANGGDATAIGQLRGEIDRAGLEFKANDRDYESQGVQLVYDWQWQSHQLSVGARYHEDEVSRFQPVDVFDQVNGSLVYQATIQPGSGDNRLEEAEAVSLWFIDDVALTERLDLTVSLRYEDYETKATRYGDLGRNTIARRETASVDEWLPGLGLTWQLNDQWQLLAGVHKGIAPSAPGADEDPEESVNYEFGGRFEQGRLFAEAIAFFSDYSNAVKNCSLASTCSGGRDFGSESFGESEVKGLELQVRYDLSESSSYRLPLSFTYTYNDAEITKDSETGSVLKGDVLENVPDQQWNLALGIEHNQGWNSYVSLSYYDETCIDTTCDRAGVDDRFLTTDDLLVVDWSASYPLKDSVRVYAKIDNLFDEQVIIAREPDGARANKPRTAYLGLSVDF